jgi:hypothetical protein
MKRVLACAIGAIALAWLGLMGISYASNGDPMILGQVNGASNTTVLHGGFKARSLETGIIYANDMPLSGGLYVGQGLSVCCGPGAAPPQGVGGLIVVPKGHTQASVRITLSSADDPETGDTTGATDTDVAFVTVQGHEPGLTASARIRRIQGTDPLQGRVIVYLSEPAPENLRVAYLDVALFGD